MLKTREIEKKFLIHTRKSLTRVFADLFNLYEDVTSDVTIGSGTDYFFDVSQVSILRVREYDEGGGEITIKNTDKATIVDREEINIKLVTAHDVEMAKLLITKLHGPPSYQVWKKYMILWMEDLGGNLVIYQTDLERPKGLILEVEAVSVKCVDKILARLSEAIRLEPVMKSLYQLTVENANAQV